MSVPEQEQQPPTLEQFAVGLSERVVEGMDWYDSYQQKLTDTQFKLNALTREKTELETEIQKLEKPVDIQADLLAYERQAIDAGNIGKFVFARSMRFPTQSLWGPQPIVDRMKDERGNQILDIAEAKNLAFEYELLTEELEASEEQIPVIRTFNLDDRNPEYSVRRKDGRVQVGWLDPGAEIVLEMGQIRLDGYPRASRVVEFPKFAVTSLMAFGSLEWGNFWDNGPIFQFNPERPLRRDRQLSLLTGRPPHFADQPETEFTEQAVLGLHDSKTGNKLIVGKERCQAFLEQSLNSDEEAEMFHDILKRALIAPATDII